MKEIECEFFFHLFLHVGFTIKLNLNKMEVAIMMPCKQLAV